MFWVCAENGRGFFEQYGPYDSYELAQRHEEAVKERAERVTTDVEIWIEVTMVEVPK